MPLSPCPNCKAPMTLATVKPGSIESEHQSFECQSCGHAEEVVVAPDPVNSNTFGWLDGELGVPPKKGNAITHTIDRGRLVPHPAR
jgi:Zn ribbon nucleic-acid-binding protein